MELGNGGIIALNVLPWGPNSGKKDNRTLLYSRALESPAIRHLILTGLKCRPLSSRLRFIGTTVDCYQVSQISET